MSRKIISTEETGGALPLSGAGTSSIRTQYRSALYFIIKIEIIYIAILISALVFIPLAIFSNMPYRIYHSDTMEIRKIGDSLWRPLAGISGFGAIYKLIDILINANELVKIVVLATTFFSVLPMITGLLVYIRIIFERLIRRTSGALWEYTEKKANRGSGRSRDNECCCRGRE